MSLRKCLVQFAKSPEFEPVKTRLRPVLSESQCQGLHQNLVRHMVERLQGVDDMEHCLWSTQGGEFIDKLCRDYGLSHHRQAGGDLGERMGFALRASLSRFDAVLLIGSDCPYLDTGVLLEVSKSLERFDLVIVPAEDGGYVLLAAKAYHPDLFSGISWGTSTVLAETLRQADTLGLAYCCLDALPDIDRPEDLQALLAQDAFAYLLPPK